MAATEPSRPGRSVLERHLEACIAQSGADRFIHEDLEAFLRLRLSDYLKREVVQLGDLAEEDQARRLSARVRATERAAGEVIGLLAQTENLRKAAWVKKKFVTYTRYCVALGFILSLGDGEARGWLLDEIGRNDAQRDEWARLFHLEVAGEGPALSRAFLEAHPTLMADTKHFTPAFTARLLTAAGDLEAATDGLLVHADNHHAMGLLAACFSSGVKCIYMDPPYNTGKDLSHFKDRYGRASWLTLMATRLELTERLMGEDGALFISIDGHERDRLKALADGVLGPERYLNTFVWVNNLKGRQISGRGAAGTHEYVLAFGGAKVGTFAVPVEVAKKRMPSSYKGFRHVPRQDERGRYVLKNELYNTNSRFNEKTRPNLVFTIHHSFASGEVRFSDVDDPVRFDGFVAIQPRENRDGVHRFHAWRWSREKIESELAELEFVPGDPVRIYTKVRDFGTTVLKDVITDIPTSAGGFELARMFGAGAFKDYPKPSSLVELFAGQAGDGEWVFDFFAGSGSTGQAVINLNRADGARRRFGLVEMGEHFEGVLVERIKKAVFAPQWKAGRPIRRPAGAEAARGPRLVKVLSLETYEEALGRLYPAGKGEISAALGVALRGDQLDGYPCRTGAGPPGAVPLAPSQREPLAVDVGETLALLLGLRIQGATEAGGVSAWWGLGRGGEKVLILWLRDGTPPAGALEAWLGEKGFGSGPGAPDVIYAPGGDLPCRHPAGPWRVESVEKALSRLMFEDLDP